MRPCLLGVIVLSCAYLVTSHSSLDDPPLFAPPQESSDNQVILERQRRYLLYPNGDPARVQFIIGLGLPLDLEDQAVTIGYVIKLLYHVPQEASDYAVNMFASAAEARSARNTRNSAKCNIDHGANTTIGNNELCGIEDAESNANIITQESNKNDSMKNSGSADGAKRNVIYSEGGIIAEDENYKRNLMKVREQERKKFLEKIPKTTRWDIYKVLENLVEINGLNGRACILKTICEAADTPFTYKNGLLGELVHIIFTPSTSDEKVSAHSDNEYHAAEKLGADERSDCERLFPECHESLIEMFSEVGFESVFG